MLQMLHFTSFFLNFITILLVKILLLVEGCLAMAILQLISLMHLAPFVIMLFEQ